MLIGFIIGDRVNADLVVRFAKGSISIWFNGGELWVVCCLDELLSI